MQLLLLYKTNIDHCNKYKNRQACKCYKYYVGYYKNRSKPCEELWVYLHWLLSFYWLYLIPMLQWVCLHWKQLHLYLTLLFSTDILTKKDVSLIKSKKKSCYLVFQNKIHIFTFHIYGYTAFRTCEEYGTVSLLHCFQYFASLKKKKDRWAGVPFELLNVFSIVVYIYLWSTNMHTLYKNTRHQQCILHHIFLCIYCRCLSVSDRVACFPTCLSVLSVFVCVIGPQ